MRVTFIKQGDTNQTVETPELAANASYDNENTSGLKMGSVNHRKPSS